MSDNKPLSIDSISPYGRAVTPGRRGTPFEGMDKFERPRRQTIRGGGVWSEPVMVSRPSVAYLTNVSNNAASPPDVVPTCRMLYTPADPDYDKVFVLHGKGANAAAFLQGPGSWRFYIYTEYVDTEEYIEYNDIIADLVIVDASHPIAAAVLCDGGSPDIRAPFINAVPSGISATPIIIFPANPFRKIAFIENVDFVSNQNIDIYFGTSIVGSTTESFITLLPGGSVSFAGEALHKGAIWTYGTNTVAAANIAAYEGTE